MKNKILIFIGIIAILFIVGISMIFSYKETVGDAPNEPVQTEVPTITEPPTDEPVVSEEPEETVAPSLSPEEKIESDAIFGTLLKNEAYQTTAKSGDTLVDIKFKGVGTVTFKLYTDKVPKTTAWFTSLIKNNTKPIKEGVGENYAYWSFETIDREYHKEEVTRDLFPMKGCIYQKSSGTNRFYICLGDIELTENDTANFSKEVCNYFKKNGGNFALYDEVTVLGRAVGNIQLLDKLGDNYKIEGISVYKK